jgi:Ca2+-binding EF-hand superfamily protein
MQTGMTTLVLAIPLLFAPAWVAAQRSDNFPAADRNGDKVIDRSEWDGTRAAFRRHDRNADGVLSGNEVPGWFYDRSNNSEMSDMSRSTIEELDRDGNGYIDGYEWRGHGRMADFRAMDRDRDGRVSSREFYRQDTRARTADRLDRNASGRIEGYEWPYNAQLFHQLDTNGDSTLTDNELQNMSKAALKQLDRNHNNVIDSDEWPGGFANFRDLDANYDGHVTADEYFSRGGEWQRRQRFRAWDKNGDGIIQSTEWRTAADLFHRLDTNQNSQVEWQEFMNDQQTYLTPNRW